MNIFTKIFCALTKPTIVLLGGEKCALTLKAIYHALDCQLSTTPLQLLLKKVLILPMEERSGFLKNSPRVILGLGLMPEPLLKELYSLGALLRDRDLIVYASESKKGEKTAYASKARSLSFGIKAEDDLVVSDIRRDNGNTNFKVSFSGNTVPIWLDSDWNRLEIYAVLLAIAVCLQLGSNLVQVSQSLKNFEK